MAIGDILDDIKDNVENKDTLNIAEESIAISVPKESKVKINIDDFDKKVISKFNNFYNKLVIKKNISVLTKLDRSIACEVFTMIPEISIIEQAKLTNNPSTLNKAIVDSALKDVTDEIPNDITVLLENIKNQIDGNLSEIDNVNKNIAIVKEKLSYQENRLSKNKPIVISDGVVRNLFLDKTSDIMYLDDKTFEYEKYSGVLTEKFRAIITNDTLNTYINFYKKDEEEGVSYKGDLSLFDIVSKLINTSNLIAAGYVSLIEDRKEIDSILNSEDKTITENTEELVNSVEHVINRLKHFKLISDILETENNFIDLTIELLEFID